MRRIAPFLFLHPNGVYYFRGMVPKHLVTKKEIKKSLKSDKSASILLLMYWIRKTDLMFARGEHNNLIADELMLKLPNGVECTLTFMLSGS